MSILKNIYLGHPYKPDCIRSFATNNYTTYQQNKENRWYHENVCVIEKLFENICSSCGCYPNYAEVMPYFKPHNRSCDKPWLDK